MILMIKGGEPQILQNNHNVWTEELVAVTSRPAADALRVSKYRHKDIKEAVVKEAFGKCVYCESKILHDQFGDIEHYFPKSIHPNLAFNWRNLMLACKKCNTFKLDRDPFAEYILDPFEPNPDDHLGFCGALIYSKTEAGEETRSVLSLDRTELNERRSDVLKRLLLVLDKILDVRRSKTARSAIYDDFLEHELASSNQYTAVARNAHAQLRPQILASLA